jgi:hypothetical protein
MFVKTVATIARFSLLVLPVSLAASINCGSSNDNGTGKGGSGGSSAGTAGSSAGTTGTGGSGTGGTGTGAKDCTVAAATATDMTILDFNTAIAAGMTPSFGGYMAGTYGGGTYDYPDKAMSADAMGLTSTFDGMTWHITGLVRDYSGFGLYLTSITDASMFGGLSFDISGTFTAAGDAGAPTMMVTMTVSDVAHDVDSLHTADGSMTCGTCAPTSSQYDGTCAAPSKVIPITATATTQTVHWTDLTGGKRPPSFTGESPNPAKLSAIAWALPWNGAGSALYTVDITIDNIKYITP